MSAKKNSVLFLILCILALLLPMNAPAGETETEKAGSAGEKTIRILATSDLHGKMTTRRYVMDRDEPSGSMTKLMSAVRDLRTENTLLVDAGDTIQDNFADIFNGHDIVHPMVRALNAIGYDVWVTGNHEYNFGMDTVRKTIRDLDAKTLVGNVIDENGDPLADGYAIFNIDGVRVAVIGMVTPNITFWDEPLMQGCTVTNPLDATRAILEEIRGQYDVLVGVFHLGLENEYGVEGSGVIDICNAFPEFDVMVSSHHHKDIPGEYINGVLVVQNRSMARSISVIDLTLADSGSGWEVKEKTSENVELKYYPEDEGLKELLIPWDDVARAYCDAPIGTLKGGSLAPENEISAIPTAWIEDTALSDLINNVQLRFSGARVSATAIVNREANIKPGPIRVKDTALLYPFENQLTRVRMNGAQLKEFMEYASRFFNTWHPGDLTFSFNEEVMPFMYMIFKGVNYSIDVSKEPGQRIQDLTWPDGTPVRDDDEFDLAVCDYIVNSILCKPGVVFSSEEEIPVVEDAAVGGSRGNIRALIEDYIEELPNSTLYPYCDHSWKIIGNDWDPALHEKAVRLLASGKIAAPNNEIGSAPFCRPLREEDLPQ